MRTDAPRIARATALAFVLLAVPFGACGGDDEGGDGNGTGGPAPSGPVVEVEASDGLDFGEDEYAAPAGEITFVYEGGNIQHSLVVDGYEDDMRLVISGDRDEGTLALDAGEYVLYCDIAGHREAGMVANLTVE